MMGELELLRGKPILIGLCKIHPLTLGEIVDMGEMTYNQYLSSLMMDKNSLDLSNLTDDEFEQVNKLTEYEVIVIHCLRDEFIREIITSSFSTFLKEKVTFHEQGFFYIDQLSDERFILAEQFEQIKLILQKQNYLQTKKEEKQLKPADERTRLLMEKMQKAKEKVQKQKKDDGLLLSDIVSIVSTYSNINLLDIWNLKIYQLYEIYLRIIMWDEYHNNYILLPHVSDSSTLNLKHWASSTKLNNQTLGGN